MDITKLYKLIDKRIRNLSKKEALLGWIVFLCEVSEKGNYDDESKKFLKKYIIKELNLAGTDTYINLITNYVNAVVEALPNNEHYYVESMEEHYNNLTSPSN